MNHLASFAECKELYNLSGWNGQYWWYSYQEYEDGSGGYVIVGEHEAPFHSSTYPAYDMGYLLAHMLPVVLTRHSDESYTAVWENHLEHLRIEGHSRTNAANALCRLAVMLFLQGFLRSDK